MMGIPGDFNNVLAWCQLVFIQFQFPTGNQI